MAAERPQRGAWYALIILTLVYSLYNVDRNLVVICSEPIRREFGLSDTQIGFLNGTAFALAFFVAGIPLGFLIDRTRRTRLLAMLLTVWSVATSLCGFTRAYAPLIITRLFVGGAESGCAPTSLSILSDYYPKERRGSAIGIFYLATPVGLAIGFAIGSILAERMGWRNVFFIAGIPGIILALVLLFLREPQRGVFDQENKGLQLSSALGQVLAAFGQKTTLLLLITAAVCLIFAQAGTSSFLPGLLVRYHHLPLSHAGLYIAAIHGLGGAIGMPLGGFMSDFVTKRSLSLAPLLVGIIVLIATPLVVYACFAPSIETTVGCYLGFVVLTNTYLGPTFATYLTLAPTNIRGAMSAAMLIAMNVIGAGLGPQITGIVSDTLKAHGVVEPLRVAMALVGGLLGVSGLLYLIASATTKRDAQGIEGAPAQAAPAR